MRLRANQIERERPNAHQQEFVRYAKLITIKRIAEPLSQYRDSMRLHPVYNFYYFESSCN